MDHKAQKVGTLPGRGDIYQVAAPLDAQITLFIDKGIQYPFLPTVEQAVDIRLDGVFDEPQKANDFTRTSIMPVALQGEPTILCKSSITIPSLLMNPAMARVAVAAHQRNQYVPIPQEFYEFVRNVARSQEGLEPEDRTALAISQPDDFDMTPEMDDARFCFGRRVKEYFEKKNHQTIKFYNLSASSKKNAVVNYTWFNEPRSGSALNCRGGNLDNANGAFGVLVPREAGAQKTGYTLTEIKNANSQILPIVLAEAKLSGLEAMLATILTNKLLERLRENTLSPVQ